MNELEQRIVAKLSDIGVDGIDEDDLCDDETFAGDEPGDVGASICSLRAAGTVDDLGCYGVRLSLKEWGRRIAERLGVSDRGDEIEAILRGSSIAPDSV
jgi:hypothetical protein